MCVSWSAFAASLRFVWILLIAIFHPTHTGRCFTAQVSIDDCCTGGVIAPAANLFDDLMLVTLLGALTDDFVLLSSLRRVEFFTANFLLSARWFCFYPGGST
jgi:hypothetical protein